MLQETNEDDVELMQGSHGHSGGYIGRTAQNVLRKALIASAIAISILSVVVLIIGISTAKEYVPEEKWNSFRLPQSVVPLHYILRISPNMDDFTFEVHENIQIEISERNTQTIYIHGVNLNISNVELVRSHKSGSITPQHINYVEEHSYYELHFGKPLYEWMEGDKHFNLTFNAVGVISDVISGFYRSSYVDSNNQTQWLAVTDFEPTSAREAFICFDEPIFKATWKLSIVIDSSKGWKAFSNMPIIETTPVGDANHVEVSFEKSVKMSSYLVCFVVCKYDVLESDRNNISGRIPVRVLATPDSISNGEFSAEFGSDVVAFFENYFNISYALPKLDLIAIPDFTSGAMENWGLITFRESALLYDDKVSSTSSLQRIAMIVAHEIAHQWFGNYVTMTWWDDIWLNEGFASFMEFVSVASLKPDWDMWTQFVAQDRLSAMSLDALNTSHPLATPITAENEILQQFDPISYNKGASVIRMLENYMNSRENNLFARGISHYLKSHAFSNAKTNDLWQALTEISGDSEITPMMKSWTTQTGFPYLSVQKHSLMGDTVVLYQRRFLLDGVDESTIWTIPVEIQTKSGTIIRQLMKEHSILVNVSDLLLVNPDGIGFYRVFYETESYLTEIIDRLHANVSSISDASKAALINDAFSLNIAGKAPISYPFKVIGYMDKERQLVPWMMATSNLNRIASLIDLETYYGDYSDFVLSLINETVIAIGWEGREDESHPEKLLRPIILGTAVNFDHKPTIDKAFEYFRRIQNDSTVLDSLSGDLRGLIYEAIVQNGGEEEWNWVFEQYQNAQLPSEKDTCLFSLARTRIPYLLQRTLDLSLDTTYVRSKDTVDLIVEVSFNVYGRDLAWNYVKENFDTLMDRYGSTAFLLNDLLDGLTRNVVTESRREELEQFFKAAGEQIDEGSRSIEQSMERIAINIKWLNANKEPLKQWLDGWRKSLVHQ